MSFLLSAGIRGNEMPDSAVYNIVADDLTESEGESVDSWPAGLGSPDLAITGTPTYRSDSFSGESSVEWDGTDDHGEMGPPDDYFDPTSAFAIGLELKTGSGQGVVLGMNDDDGSQVIVHVGPRGGGDQPDNGEITVTLREGSAGNAYRIGTSDTVNDGDEKAILINKTANTGGDGVEFYINGNSAVSTTTHTDQGFDGGSFGAESLYLAAWNNAGSATERFNGEIRRLTLYEDSLTDSERDDHFSLVEWL